MRQELRELVEAYGARVDARDYDGAADLFVEDGALLVPDVPTTLAPNREIRGRSTLAATFKGLERYRHTLHMIGYQTIEARPGGASGVTACLAHHVVDGADGPEDRVWAIRYLDDYVEDDGRWRFATRSLWVDWVEVRPVSAVRPR